MTHLNFIAITAFFAVGKRVTLDIKILEHGRTVYKLQIEEYSMQSFIQSWDASFDAFLAAIGNIDPAWSNRVRRDFSMFEYHDVESLNAIADLVLHINSQW